AAGAPRPSSLHCDGTRTPARPARSRRVRDTPPRGSPPRTRCSPRPPPASLCRPPRWAGAVRRAAAHTANARTRLARRSGRWRYRGRCSLLHYPPSPLPPMVPWNLPRCGRHEISRDDLLRRRLAGRAARRRVRYLDARLLRQGRCPASEGTTAGLAAVGRARHRAHRACARGAHQRGRRAVRRDQGIPGRFQPDRGGRHGRGGAHRLKLPVGANRCDRDPPGARHQAGAPARRCLSMRDDRDFDDEDDSVEAKVWQLLLLINPGDEETALQQFSEYREAAAEERSAEPVALVARVIDWRSGFMIAEDDLRSLVQALDELSARWNLSIDWDGDPDDDDYFDDADAGSLLGIAYDRLAESGYTLWTWETEDDSYAGWITLARDSEPMRELATALHINLRPGSDFG